MTGGAFGSPRLRPTLQRVLTADGRLLIAGGPDGDVHEIEGDAPRIDAFLALLDGTRSVAEIAAATDAGSGTEVTGALRELAAAGLIDDASQDGRWLAPAEIERFDRQLRYFGDVAPDLPRALAQARLRDSTVAVLGLGGLGGTTALLLAASGVGHIVGVDDDRVEVSNLARQVLYDEGDLGRRKVAAAGRRLRRLSGRLAFDGRARTLASVADVVAAVRGATLVIAAADRPALDITGWIDRACFVLGVPYLEMSQHPPKVRVGPLRVPGRTGCHHCARASLDANDPVAAAVIAGAAAESPAAAYAPTSALIAAIAANEAIAYLTGLHEPATLGTAIVLDVRTMESERRVAPRRPGCEVCASFDHAPDSSSAPGADPRASYVSRRRWGIPRLARLS